MVRNPRCTMFFRKKPVTTAQPDLIPSTDRPLLVDLLSKLGEIEVRRMETQVQLHAAESKARLDDLEREVKLKKEMAEWRREQREKRKELVSSRPRNENGRFGAKKDGCRVCANPSEPSLTANEIIAHHAGHPQVH